MLPIRFSESMVSASERLVVVVVVVVSMVASHI